MRTSTPQAARQSPFWKQTLLIEDNLSRVMRSSTHFIGVNDTPPEAFAVTLHSITKEGPQSFEHREVERPPAGDWKSRRVEAALSLLDETPLGSSSVVIAGTGYGSCPVFLEGVVRRQLSFAVEVPAMQKAQSLEEGAVPNGTAFCPISKLADERTADGGWFHLTFPHPIYEQPISYAAVRVGPVLLDGGTRGWLSVLRTGAILNSPRAAAFVLASEPNVSFEELIHTAGWTRWIRPYMRRKMRPDSTGIAENSRQWSLRTLRPVSVTEREAGPGSAGKPRSLPGRSVRLVELFAGGGGMGLGFFMAEHRPPVHLLYSGEVHPVYAETLRLNHGALAARPETQDQLPEETSAVDLRGVEAQEQAAAAVGEAGGVDILIGGPPCQGFSSANRHSWHGSNPHNLLIDTYLGYVARLRPSIFVMENVQGIVSSPKAGQGDPSLSVLDYFAQQMTQAGYRVFPKLLDASLYGVPQRRNRCFIVGLREDLGYGKGSFDAWGPFPKPTHGPGTGAPFVTVGDAIGDLPKIGNGETKTRQAYTAPPEAMQNNPFLRMMRAGEDPGVVTDHVTSRHADYVIERYQKIPPGGNWQDIRDQLTNYASAGRTHSNIYRRLEMGEPSITIGHYRKSMIVHPDQPRGLSLREAARLQSFPDWFRFAGAVAGQKGGDSLGHKQQQLANAVCPLVTKALSEFLFGLLR